MGHGGLKGWRNTSPRSWPFPSCDGKPGGDEQLAGAGRHLGYLAATPRGLGAEVAGGVKSRLQRVRQAIPTRVGNDDLRCALECGLHHRVSPALYETCERIYRIFAAAKHRRNARALI